MNYFQINSLVSFSCNHFSLEMKLVLKLMQVFNTIVSFLCRLYAITHSIPMAMWTTLNKLPKMISPWCLVSQRRKIKQLMLIHKKNSVWQQMSNLQCSSLWSLSSVTLAFLLLAWVKASHSVLKRFIILLTLSTHKSLLILLILQILCVGCFSQITILIDQLSATWLIKNCKAKSGIRLQFDPTWEILGFFMCTSMFIIQHRRTKNLTNIR